MSEIASRAALAEPTGNNAAATLAPEGHLFTQFALGQQKKSVQPETQQGKLLPRYPGTYSGNPGVKSAVGECGRGGEKMEGNLYCRKWSWEVDLMELSGAQLEI